MHAHTHTSRVFMVTCWARHSLSQLQRPWFRIGKAKTREDWTVRLFPFPQIRPSRVFSLLEGKYTHYSACFMKVLTLVGRNQQKDRLSSAMLESRIFNMWLWGGTLTGSFWKWATVLLWWADWYQALTTPSSDGARIWLHFSWGWSLFYSQGGRDWLWLNSGRSGDLNQVWVLTQVQSFPCFSAVFTPFHISVFRLVDFKLASLGFLGAYRPSKQAPAPARF